MIENGTRVERFGRPVVVVARLHSSQCTGCAHSRQSANWCADETVRVFGSNRGYVFPCYEHQQMFIHDTPEAWDEYLRARLAGDSTGQTP